MDGTIDGEPLCALDGELLGPLDGAIDGALLAIVGSLDGEVDGEDDVSAGSVSTGALLGELDGADDGLGEGTIDCDGLDDIVGFIDHSAHFLDFFLDFLVSLHSSLSLLLRLRSDVNNKSSCWLFCLSRDPTLTPRNRVADIPCCKHNSTDIQRRTCSFVSIVMMKAVCGCRRK